MDQIIDFLSVKGIIEPSKLFEAPFTDINATGIAGLFNETQALKIIAILETVNASAAA